MTSFQRILFPVDLSEECMRTAPYVKAFADRFRSDVILLHVFELPVTLFGFRALFAADRRRRHAPHFTRAAETSFVNGSSSGDEVFR